MLTNRIKPFLEKVIGPQQTGYVPGRYIGVNIRKLIDLLLFLEREEIQAVLIAVDFEKCFDSIKHDALFEALRYFNVGEYFISWIKTIYNKFEFCVTNNGRSSIYYTHGRGVHQGSALSGPVFLFTAEILALNIKANSKIKGIQTGQATETVAQYADDTNIWSLLDEQSIK